MEYERTLITENEHEDFENRMAEYNDKIKQIPVIELKKTISSWIVLTLSILATIAVACSIASVISKISNSWFTLVVGLVQLLLISLVCAGFWRTYIAGKSKQASLNSGGPRMLRGVLRFYEVIVCLVIVAIIILAVILLISTKSCSDEFSKGAEASNSELGDAINTVQTGVSSVIIGILIAMIIVLTIAFIVVIIYYKTAISFASTVIDSIDAKYSQCPFTYISLTVMLFIIGGFNLLIAISQIGMANFLNDFFNELGEIGAFFNSAKLTTLDVANLLSQIAQSGMYIFGGIFIISYNKLHTNIRNQLAALKKPIR